MTVAHAHSYKPPEHDRRAFLLREAQAYLKTAAKEHRHLPSHLASIVALGSNQVELEAKYVRQVCEAASECPVCSERIRYAQAVSSGIGYGAFVKG